MHDKNPEIRKVCDNTLDIISVSLIFLSNQSNLVKSSHCCNTILIIWGSRRFYAKKFSNYPIFSVCCSCGFLDFFAFNFTAKRITNNPDSISRTTHNSSSDSKVYFNRNMTMNGPRRSSWRNFGGTIHSGWKWWRRDRWRT